MSKKVQALESYSGKNSKAKYTSLAPGQYPEEREIGNCYFAMMMVFDFICYGLISYRDNIFKDGSYQNIIFHYSVVWIAFTDILSINVAKNKRYWWNIFRAVQGVEIAWLTAALWIEDLDDKEVGMTIARLTFWIIRAIWGAIYTYNYGPWTDHWLAFIHERRVAHRSLKWY